VSNQPETVRSRTSIVKGLLRRAFNGESGYTLAEMKEKISFHLTRARDMPEGHAALLQIIHAVEQENRDRRAILRSAGLTDDDIGPDSRALRNLSIIERMAGRKDASYATVVALPLCDEVRPELNPAPVALMYRPW
jgi:hypothetical protein